jgi:hypothetical protein
MGVRGRSLVQSGFLAGALLGVLTMALFDFVGPQPVASASAPTAAGAR